LLKPPVGVSALSFFQCFDAVGDQHLARLETSVPLVPKSSVLEQVEEENCVEPANPDLPGKQLLRQR